MIAAMQKLNISRLSIFIILLPGSPNALAQIATIRREKQDRNDRRVRGRELGMSAGTVSGRTAW